jgi:Putative auto-transporter adhesin, head GIN domain
MKPRSLFWPFVMIATGVIWILVNQGLVPSENLWALYYAIPWLLLVLGVGLVLRSRWHVVGMVVSALAVVAMALAIVFAAPLQWDTAPNWETTWGNYSFGGLGGVAGSGVSKTETRDLPEFTAIRIDYPAEIFIRQGEKQSVTISADDNLLPQLRTNVSGGVLTLISNESSYSRRVNPTMPVEIEITVKDLREVSYPTAGSVRVEDFQTDALKITVDGAGELILEDVTVGRLAVDLNGAGSVTAHGTADSLVLRVDGVGSFKGADLSIGTAQVTINGAGSAVVWVKEKLTVDINGIGSVNYYGSPTVHQNVGGLGSVQHEGNK